jgi:hypothetical protein
VSLFDETLNILCKTHKVFLTNNRGGNEWENTLKHSETAFHVYQSDMKIGDLIAPAGWTNSFSPSHIIDDFVNFHTFFKSQAFEQYEYRGNGYFAVKSKVESYGFMITLREGCAGGRCTAGSTRYFLSF